MNNDELLEIFIEEALDLLSGLGQHWKQSEQRAQDQTLMHQFLQDLHTLKGGAKMVGQEEVSELAHAFEQFIQQGDLQTPSVANALIEEGMRLLEDMIMALGAGQSMPHCASYLVKIKPQKQEDFEQNNSLSSDSLQILHKEGLELCRQMRHDVKQLQVGQENQNILLDLEQCILRFKGCVTIASLHELVQFCVNAQRVVRYLVDHNVLITQKLIDGFYRIYDTLIDALESLVLNQNLPALTDVYQEMVQSIEGNDVNRIKTNEKSNAFIRVNVEKIEALGELAESLNIGRSGLWEHVQSIAKRYTETLKELKLANEMVRFLELQSDSVTNWIHKDYHKEHHDFDILEFDHYTQFGQNTRQLAATIHKVRTDCNYFFNEIKEVQQSIGQLSLLTQQLEEDLTHIRMVSMEQFLPRLQTVVERVAKELHKDIKFTCLKIEGEVDRQVVQRLMPALEHIIRNCIDHGIEHQSERLHLEKPPFGTITFAMFYEGKNLIIELSDDGRGLDRERILSQACEQNLTKQHESFANEDVYNFIFYPGFTTKEEVTQISGRGMGMDAVKSVVTKLGGGIHIVSEPNQGTKFVIRLPLMLSLNHLVLFRLGGNHFAFPLTAVLGVSRIRMDTAHKNENQELTIHYSDQEYPCHHLHDVLGVGTEQGSSQEYRPVILVKSKEVSIGFIVDEIIGHRESVIKPLGKQLQLLREFVGFANAGEGRLALILSEEIVCKRVILHEHFGMAQQDPLCVKVMVVDDSLTVRKVTEQFLTRYGHAVETAQDGLDAFAKIDVFDPDIILLDIEMPRMNGYQFLEALRAQGKFTTTPVIVISSRSESKHQEKARQLGANSVLTKPYSEQELLSVIEQLTGDHIERKQHY